MSARLSCDLGELELLQKADDLRLTLSTSAFFDQLKEDHSDLEVQVSEPIWRKTWLSYRSNIRLQLELAGDAIPVAAHDEAFNDLLFARLQDWQVRVLDSPLRVCSP